MWAIWYSIVENMRYCTERFGALQSGSVCLRISRAFIGMLPHAMSRTNLPLESLSGGTFTINEKVVKTVLTPCVECNIYYHSEYHYCAKDIEKENSI